MNLPAPLRRSIEGPNHKWWALATVGLGAFMSTLDSSIVNVTLPSILRAFRTDLATVEWVVLAYLLTITATLLTFGRLADLRGRKKVYTIGFGIFTLGSLLCGLSPSPPLLIGARVVQAVGAAMIQANGLAITSAVFPKEERGRALGINGTLVSAGITTGPAIGGLLTDAFGWRSIFLVNLPIGLLGIALALIVLQEGRISVRREAGAGGFDPLGAALVAVALVTLLLGLNQAPAVGWSARPILALFATAAVAFAAFLLVERRVAAPLLSLDLFRIRSFAAGTLAALLIFLAISANAFLLPFFLQLVLGYSPAEAGLMLIPTSLTMALIAPVSGWLSDRFGARALSSLGLGLTSAALLLIGGLGAGAHYADLLWRLVLLGLGAGIFMSPNTSAVLGSVPRAQYGVAGGFVSMVRNTGSMIGVAIAGAILLHAIAPAVGDLGLEALGEAAPGGERAPTVAAFVAGFRQAYFVAAAFAALGIAVSLSRGRQAQPAGTAEPAGEAPAAAGGRARLRETGD